MVNIAGKLFKNQSKVRKMLVRTAGQIIACYGAYTFIKRENGSYMPLKNQFVFFDFDEPIILFLLNYMQ